MTSPPTPPPAARAAPLVVTLVGCLLVLPLLVVPALSRRTLSGLLWSIREGGPGMLLLFPLGLGVSAVLVIVGALRKSGTVRGLGLALPVALPLVAWGFYRLGMGKAFSAISGASVEPLVKLRILAEAASEVGNLLSLAAFLCVATAFIAAVWAFASAIAASPRLAFGRSAAIASGLGLATLVGALLIASRQSGEVWHWLAGALIVLFGTPLALVAFAAVDGAASGSSGAPGTPPHAVSTHTLVALFALGASLASAYFATRNEITNVMFSAVGGESIDPTRREEYLRAGLDALAGLGVAHAALAAPLAILFALLLVLSSGRALAPASLRDAVAVALAPLAVAGVVLASPEAAWEFIQETSAKTRPGDFAFISTQRTSLDRDGGFALYLDASRVTVGGSGALQTISLEPNDDCPERLAQLVESLSRDDLRGPALAIARDATGPGIRCGVLGTLLFRGVRFMGRDASSDEIRFDSTSFDLILQYGPDASDLPAPFDALAPHRGTLSVEIAARADFGRADRLHLAGDAWRFSSEERGEQRFEGDDESRFAELRARLSQGRVLEVSAAPNVPAELVIRALVLPDAARLVLEAPSPPGLDGWTEPWVPPTGARGTAKVRMGASTVSGRLPAEVIQRIVRQNYGRFRLCHEQGLGRNPALQGRVSVRFVIDRSGAVSNVANAGSDLPDAGVVQCVLRSFYGLSFPRPESGIVTVVYPVMFSPG